MSRANWLQPGFNTWAFQHTGSVLPTAVVSRQATPSSALKFSPRSLGGFNYLGIVDGVSKTLSLADFLRLSFTDAFLVMHNGEVVFERYFNGMSPDQRHVMMSVTKSFTGTLAAMLVQEGRIDPSANVDSYVPELSGSELGNITVRDALNMTTGIAYSEDYADPNADVWIYTPAVGLLAAPDDYRGPTSIRAYLPTMKRAEAAGSHFEYVTPASEVLVWIVDKVTGKPFTEVLSERIWSELGMERDALFIVESDHHGLGGTGLIATARDLARFGQMVLQRGTYNGRQVLAPEVVEGFMKGGSRKAFERYAGDGSMKGFSYRDQWWVTHNEHGAFLAMGVYGQNIYIDPTANVVIVRQSSQPSAVTEFADSNDFVLFHALADYLMKFDVCGSNEPAPDDVQ